MQENMTQDWHHEGFDAQFNEIALEYDVEP